MTLARATYCTREDVLSVLQQAQSPRVWPDIDRAIESATTSIDDRCHRTFHPTLATRYFPWPDANSTARSWVFWLDANEICGDIVTLVSGGETIGPAGWFLEPQQYGPPYSRIETNRGSTSAFSAGTSSNQRDIAVTAPFGHSMTVQPVTILAGAIASAGAGTLAVSDGSGLGVGDLLYVDTERMIVTGRAWLTTGQTLATPLTASATNRTVAVASGSALHIGETILLDTEQMQVLDIVGNSATVERAINSTILAAHTGSTIYAPRTLSVIRGANGSTAATHTDASIVYRSVVPASVRSLALGEAIVELQQGSAGYARTAGSGDNERTIGSGPGLNDLRDQVETSFRRKVRKRAV